MSIDNIPTNYSGSEYGDYCNGTQYYTDYSVNEINGPYKVQRYTITDNSPQIYPNGYTRFALYTVTGADYTPSYTAVRAYLLANGFNKDGQQMIVVNSAKSTKNIVISSIPVLGTRTLIPGQAYGFFCMTDPDGTPRLYGF